MPTRGLRAPGPCGYFCRAAKVTKNAPEPMVLDSFLGAALGRPPRRGSEGLCGGISGQAKPPNWWSFFSRSGTCRSPPAGLSKGYCLQGALVLTVHFSDSHPLHQTFVPSAARQPGSPAGCRDGRCREAAMTSLGRTMRRSTDRHRPRAQTIDHKSEGRSENNYPRNEGRSLGNAVS